MDTKGSATLELGIVLIIIILMLAAVLSSTQDAADKIIKAEETENMEVITSEVADNLINNPGNPEKWYEYENGIPGLAIVNEGGETVPNSVSYPKFIALGDNYKKLVYEKLFNSKIKTSMELIPKKSSISSVKIGQDIDFENIFSVSRLVKCDFYKKYVIKDFQNPGKCNHNHDQSENSCSYFKIFKGNVKKSDYYLLIDDSEKYDVKYIVDTTRVVKEKYWQTANSNRINLNGEINFYDDTSAVVFIHFDKPKVKAVLVSVPKDFDRNKLYYDYFRTNDCRLILKAFY